MTLEPLTIIQTPEGESFGTNQESPSEARERLQQHYLVQQIGNVVRIVRPIKFKGLPQWKEGKA